MLFIACIRVEVAHDFGLLNAIQPADVSNFLDPLSPSFLPARNTPNNRN